MLWYWICGLAVTHIFDPTASYLLWHVLVTDEGVEMEV